ncbi:potassium channel protein [Halobacteriaceae bacterium SHR40]|uniref:potassium channel family protein n=1 Tax=Halovenus amylolytica TaxID=2500550 RepID=UPI000FE37CB3
MDDIKRRATYFVLGITALIVVSTFAYDTGMRLFEPRPYPPEDVEISLFHSMQVVVETFTATGYGSDSPWLSPEMNVMVMVLDLTGVALFFVGLPAVFLPLFQRALSSSVPTEIGDISDHVLICTYTPRAEVLIDELESNDVPYVLVEPDRGRARNIDDDGYSVVYADPESVSDLEQLNISTARALVADSSDRVDASIVLAAKEAAERTRVVSVVEEPEYEPYHWLAGADEVLSPRELLGQSLAGKLTTDISMHEEDMVSLNGNLDILEIPIRHGSEFVGQTLAESSLRDRYGVNVVGAWYQGEFEAPPDPEQPLSPGTIMLVVGDETSLERFNAETRVPARRFRRGKTIILGYGEVGRQVTATLSEADLPYTVVDRSGGEAIDIVGDATDPDVLREAGVPDARSVVLAIPDDTSTEFATLVTRDLNDSAEIIARSDSVEAIRKTYRAGADYVLSLATVSGRSIASAVLESEDILAVDTNVDIIRTTATRLAGETLANAQIRERTGCTVVAVERNGDLLTDLGAGFRIRTDDELILAGTDKGTNRFVELFC